MKFRNREVPGVPEAGTQRAEVFRLPDGEIVYLEREINTCGWARITRLSKRVGSGTPLEHAARWIYSSASAAASALAEWDPETAPAPAGWLRSKTGSSSV